MLECRGFCAAPARLHNGSRLLLILRLFRTYLENWLRGNYVHPQPLLASEEEKARQPLSDAQVIVRPQPDNPGYYHAEFLLKPHYQLEGLTVSLRLASRLKSEAQ